jgi:AraC family transcriptional regulator
MYSPAVPELVLVQVMLGGSRTRGNSGGGHFEVTSQKGDLYLGAANFAHTINVSKNSQVRKLAFPTAQWESVLDEAAGGGFSLESLQLYKGPFRSQAILSTLRNLWALSDEEGAPSRLLARAAGCEIFAELCRLSGASLAPARGGLAPWAKRRCLELMHERLSEDISLDELAAEARLSPFHFARMFKESVGVPPRVYLTRLRLERACELLETTDLPVTEIAFEVGYSSNQVLARLFLKNRRMTPSDYRRAVRDPVLSGR